MYIIYKYLSIISPIHCWLSTWIKYELYRLRLHQLFFLNKYHKSGKSIWNYTMPHIAWPAMPRPSHGKEAAWKTSIASSWILSIRAALLAKKPISQGLPRSPKDSKVHWVASEFTYYAYIIYRINLMASSELKFETFWNIIPSLRGLHKQFVLILRQARGMAAIVEGRDETLTSWISQNIYRRRNYRKPYFLWLFSSKYDM